MKLGSGLYRHMLNRDNFRFARQCGATHVIVHLIPDHTPQMSCEAPAAMRTAGVA